MIPTVITPPSATIVTLAEVKAYLRVDHTDDDLMLQAFLWAAQNEFDGPDGNLGRAVGVQVLELQLPSFPYGGRPVDGADVYFKASYFGERRPGEHQAYWQGDYIDLPYPPALVDGSHPLTVKYIDQDGVEQTVDSALYTVVTIGKTSGARVQLAYNATWPSARSQRDAVRVRWSAGYAGNDPRAEGIKTAIKIHVENAYDSFDDAKAREKINNALAVYRLMPGAA